MNFASALKGSLVKPEAAPPPVCDVSPGWIKISRLHGKLQVKEGLPGPRAAYLDECDWQADDILSRNMFQRRVQAQVDELEQEHGTLGDLGPRWHLQPQDIWEYYLTVQAQDEQEANSLEDDPDPNSAMSTARYRKNRHGGNKKWTWNKEAQSWQFFLA